MFRTPGESGPPGPGKILSAAVFHVLYCIVEGALGPKGRGGDDGRPGRTRPCISYNVCRICWKPRTGDQPFRQLENRLPSKSSVALICTIREVAG